MSTIYFDILAAAFIRGKLGSASRDNPQLFVQELAVLSAEERQALIRLAGEHELRIHRFKRTMELPRVRRVLGILKGIGPANLLDIGSGRGAFLWPLLDEFPSLPVTCIDVRDDRMRDIQAVRDGGFAHIQAIHGDVTALPFEDRSFDVITMLEVLEHIPATQQALAEICRVASRFVVLSVPSKEDNNPEHIHLFSQQQITELLREQGATRVSMEYVPNHMLVIARIG